MNALLQHLKLRAKAQTGLSAAVVVWAAAGTFFAVIGIGFALGAAFLWLADRYSPLTAALVLAGFFLLAAIVALIAFRIAHRRAAERARLALASRNTDAWLNPSSLGIALQVGRMAGASRIVPLIAAVVLAAGLAKEWSNRTGSKGDASSGNEA